MRVMVIVKATPESEAGAEESNQPAGAMDKYNEDLVKAGVMVAGEGLRPSSHGVRVSWSEDGKPVLTDGPFTEAKELIAGYWIWQVRSMDEALEWVKRSPFGPGNSLELRQIDDAYDAGDDRWRDALATRQP
jgi:hypothetical protein